GRTASGTVSMWKQKLRSTMVAAVLLGVAGSCARNPVTGKREIMLVSEGQEIQMGREAAKQIPEELGLVEDREIQEMVQTLGLQMARASERPDLPWEFHVVDSPVVNAFAIPGGFIYLTRGILAHMNTEAEMVGVMGHEIGHVTARHSAQQISRSQLAGLGLGLSMIFVPDARPFGDLLQGSLGLMFLKFGRDDETEADRLGVRYGVELGYDPRPVAGFFDVLARMREGDEVLPSWLSTHPDPAGRAQNILELARQMPGSSGELKVVETAFKRRLDGMVFGENPREGFMDGNVFKHPELRFRIAFPRDWEVRNTRRMVLAGSQNAAFQMTAARVEGNTSPSAHAARLFQQAGLQSGSGRSQIIGGFPAFVLPFREASQSGVIDGEAAFLRDGSMMYELFAYTTPDRYGRMRGTFLDVFGSFARLTSPEDLRVQPQRIRLYSVPRATNARQALMDAGVLPHQLETVALLNHLTLQDPVESGTLLKSVTRPTTRVETQ
ncbi:MAG TPA: M48 family metalloprotease, partial [Vicinamibacteria bacterium]|nr:M48 family metalloprotease [Vicinamibacteria bacterium]